MDELPDIKGGAGRLIEALPFLAVNPEGRLLPRPASADSFGRLRVSNPVTLFDCKQLFDNQPLLFDDAEVSGTGTGSTYSQPKAATTIAVANATAGRRVRQSFQRFNYQPGKSLLVLLTGVLQVTGGGAGITSSFGYYDDSNGVFVQVREGVVELGIRSSVSGSPVDTVVAQDDWNGDKMDGAGETGFTLDPTKTQIFWVDLEWLGVGTVRCGFIVDGEFVLTHTFDHANRLTEVYMSTPNLPVRYEIANDGTGVASELDHICSSVVSEGGQDPLGVLRYHSSGTTELSADSNTRYAALGIRLANPGATVEIAGLSAINTSAGNFEWTLTMNPTIAGTFTYSGVANSSVEVATGVAANTLTGGTVVDGGVIRSTNQGSGSIGTVNNALRIGASIAGVSDTMVLAVMPVGGSGTFLSSLTWRELS